MTSAYVLIFLTLFAIIGDGFVKKYLHHKISEHYSEPRFETYVHRRRPHMNQGISMKSLINNHNKYCPLFEKLIHEVYQDAPNYYPELANALLSLFQEKITFNESKIKEGKHLFEKPEDLETLPIPNKRLQEVYPFLMRGSQAFAGDSSGYPSLKIFFHPTSDTSTNPKLNLFDIPLKLIEVMFGKEVQREMEQFRSKWVYEKLSVQEEQKFIDDLKTEHRLDTHEYQDLIEFTARRGPALE